MRNGSFLPEVVVKGLVTAAEWTPNGEVRRVKIALDGEQEYWVINDQIGLKLITLVHSKIKARGYVGMDDKDRKTIRIIEVNLVANQSTTPPRIALAALMLAPIFLGACRDESKISSSEKDSVAVERAYSAGEELDVEKSENSEEETETEDVDRDAYDEGEEK